MIRTMFCLLLVVFTLSGCQKPDGTTGTTFTLADKKAKAFDAGGVAVLGYVLAEKPTSDQVTAILKVTDQLTTVLTNYKKTESFSATLPTINDGIDKAFDPKTKTAENLLAKKLAKTLVDELDHQFKTHPDWGGVASPAVDIVTSFCSGSTQALKDYQKTAK